MSTIYSLRWLAFHITSYVLTALKMSNLEAEKGFLQGILLHYFFMKKTAAESPRILVEVYGSIRNHRSWFRRRRETRKIWGRRIGSIFRWRFVSNARKTCQIISSWSFNHFRTLESSRFHSKASKIRCYMKWSQELQ